MQKRLNAVMVVAACLGILLGGQVPARAIPAFARKYGFNCTMCHSNFPRLNDFGWRYRQNGYQLPGREDDDKTVLESLAPFAMRTSVGFNHDKFKNTPDSENVSQFQVNGLDILSGGLFRQHIGYFLIYPPEIHGSSGVVAQSGTLEMGNVIFSNLGSTWLNLRAGRFEPAHVAFSGKRSLTFSPYEIHDFGFPGGFTMGETQDGLEFTGYGRRGWSYAAGWVNGSGTNESDDTPNDFYVRAAKVFGEGEGFTAGHKIGLTGYFGQARPDLALPHASRRNFTRFGADASLNFDHVNLALQFMTGRDQGDLWGQASDFDFSGGFAEISYLPRTDVVSFARYDWVSTPSSLNQDISRWTLGGRYYFADNLALHLEYSRRDQESGIPAVGDATEDFLTTRLDFAF
jgi:hypothetical protein